MVCQHRSVLNPYLHVWFEFDQADFSFLLLPSSCVCVRMNVKHIIPASCEAHQVCSEVIDSFSPVCDFKMQSYFLKSSLCKHV